MRYLVSLLTLLHLSLTISSQNLYSINSEWDDEVKEWKLVCNEGELEGYVRMVWRLKNDITEWKYIVGEKNGFIKQKWENNPNTWELRSADGVINISTVYLNDFSSFRIKDGDHSITIENVSRTRDPIEWEIRDKDYGEFSWFNEFEFDIRDWIINDGLSEEISFEMKLAAVFMTIVQHLYELR